MNQMSNFSKPFKFKHTKFLDYSILRQTFEYIEPETWRAKISGHGQPLNVEGDRIQVCELKLKTSCYIRLLKLK